MSLAKEPVMNRMMSMIALMGMAAALVGAPPARAEVPAAVDFATCNAKAADEARTASAAPGPRMGSGKPDDARGGVPAASPRSGAQVTTPGAGPGGSKSPDTSDPTGKTIAGSNDPQLEGIAADRVHEPQYVAAYRSCMRQRGF
jgi:hypothetical protein